MFPLFLNLTGRLGVVIGGGPVGRRKAAALLEAGAAVRLICLEPRPPEMASPQLEWLTEPYCADHLTGAALAFAAATAEANARVVADARVRGIWVNVADDPGAGDFLQPAVLRHGDFVIAVGTGGAAPVLAREVRDRLAGQFDDAFGHWVALLAELRPVVRGTVPEAGPRRALWKRLCRWDWVERLRREDPAAVRTAMRAEVEAASGRQLPDGTAPSGG
jgi:precorrin-2 dehydrogenase/sirohydrochlorin ferrochelatase